jgi:exonuclease VII small subunit
MLARVIFFKYEKKKKEEMYAQIETHSDRITPDKDIVSTFSFHLTAQVEHLRLSLSDFGRQTTVGHSDSEVSSRLDSLLESIDVIATEGDQTVASLDLGEVALEARIGHLERGETLVTVQDELVLTRVSQAFDQAYDALFSAEMEFLGLDAEDGLSPGIAAEVVADHLDLVDDDDVIELLAGEHLDRAARQAGGRRGYPLLLAGE